jgi:hypothetical protein
MPAPNHAARRDDRADASMPHGPQAGEITARITSPAKRSR